MMVRCMVSLIAVLALNACKSGSTPISYELVEVRDHDVACYTQGLEFFGDRLFESGGGYGESTLREVDPESGKALRVRDFPEQVFLEGLTLFNRELWVLTWEQGKVFVLDPETFELKRTYKYEGEGWGLTHDGKHLIMSDGSNVLEYRNGEDFSVVKSIEVKEEGRDLYDINELEYVDGQLFANLYQQDRIVRISLPSGEVTGQLDLSDLSKNHPDLDSSQVLNGIAYHAESGLYWVTGKNWPKIYLLKLGK